MNGGPFNPSAADLQTCDVYRTLDFIANSGLNAGDEVSTAIESNIGEKYVFSPDAIACDIVIDDAAQDVGYSPYHIQATTFDPSTGAETNIGTLGLGPKADSRLTFMGTDGSCVEILFIATNDELVSDYILPLTPLKPNLEYTLIKADTDPGTFRLHLRQHGPGHPDPHG